MQEFNVNRGLRLAQKTLAYEVTKLVHGQDRADSVVRISNVLFASGDYQDLTIEDFNELSAELGIHNVQNSSSLVDVLVSCELASSKADARRFLESGAIYINGQQISGTGAFLEGSQTLNGYAVLRRGKNSQAIVKIS